MSERIKSAWSQLVEIAKSGENRTRSVDEHVKAERAELKKIDGRTLRKTGRTDQLNVRVAAETKAEIQALANAHDWLIGEVIEKAVAALKREMRTGK